MTALFQQARRFLLGQRWTAQEGEELTTLIRQGSNYGRAAQSEVASRLNAQEQAVLDVTVELWNQFLRLPAEHPDDVGEFRHKIHELQNMILSRPTRRAINRAGPPPADPGR